ncbi:sensor histidine kinase [Lachnospiraceae bacterium OttesenSCG-928-D06]|nr:sensor histidine kinase [Lachnospiraceae bacterium OttesenSCG-928-D06]
MKEKLQNLPFKFRIFFGCLIVALIPLLFTSIFIVRIFEVSLERQSNASLKTQLEEIQIRLDQLFASCQDACLTLANDESVYRVMLDNTRIEVQKDLYLSLYQAVQETYSYASFSIYDAGGQLRFTTDNSGAQKTLPLHWGLLRLASANEGVSYYRTDPYFNNNTNIVLQAACALDSRQGARVGYIVLDFTTESFHRLFQSNDSAGDVILLLDPFLEPFYCSRPEYNEADMRQLFNRVNKSSKTDGLLYAGITSEAYNHTVILQKNSQISSPAIRTLNTISFLLAIFCLWLCLFVSFALSRSISQPISELDRAMKEVSNGDLTVRVLTTRTDELGRLTNSFNRMTKELDEHLEAAVQKQKDLNDTSLRLFQTQLNPHFLYNTLDTIKWSAKINNDKEIPLLAENLAMILRRSISSEPFITLTQELETIRNYIEIQKIRFTGRFLYDEEIPYHLENCLIPKMILQPLVENAILHGLDGCENGYICIYATTSKFADNTEVIHISVTDDGRGISEEMMEWTNSPNPTKRAGHVGLYNIIQILKLYYGKEHGLHAEQNPEGGTTVTISLPIERKI